jgi:predicted AlkP superfamily phosphohydrolase/phosphomutase
MIDGCFAWFLERIGEEDVVIALSDHGFQTCQDALDLNSWLEARGFALKKVRGEAQREWRMGSHPLVQDVLPGVIVPKAVLVLARRFPVLRMALLRAMKALGKEVKFHPPYELDIEASIAFAPKGSPYGIFVNGDLLGSIESSREVVSSIVQGLKEMRHPATGEPLFEVVGSGEEVYGAGSREGGPDIVVIPSKGLFLDVTFTHGASLVPKDCAWHSQEGFLIIAGGTSKRGHRMPPCHMRDIAPTILGLMGVEPPPHMDGRILEGAFEFSVGIRGS